MGIRCALLSAGIVLACLVAGCGGGGGGDGGGGPSPTLTSVTPSSIEWMDGTDISLFGENLDVGGGTATIRFRATTGTPFANGTSSTLDLPGTVASATEIRGRVPFACVGSPTVVDVSCILQGGATSTLPGALSFDPQTKVVDPDGSSPASLGTSVASALDWNLAGAPLEFEDGLESGTAYFYDAAGGTRQKVAPDDGQSGAHFGSAVALGADYAVIGAPGAGTTGAAYVFWLSGDPLNPWVQSQKLTASDGFLGDEFGSAVAISFERIAVGAPGADRGTSTDAGAVYVFEHNGMAFSQVAKLGASDRNTGDAFGSSVSVAYDRVLVGAPLANIDLALIDAGAVYAFEHDGSWPVTETVKVEAPAPRADAHFGASVDQSQHWLLVGTPGDDELGVGAGAVHSFRRSGSDWTHLQKVLAPGGGPGDEFGYSVELTALGGVVGAPGVGGIGAAYVLYQDQQLFSILTTIRPSPGVAGDRFGTAVSSFYQVAVGAPGDDDMGGGAGAFYVH